MRLPPGLSLTPNPVTQANLDRALADIREAVLGPMLERMMAVMEREGLLIERELAPGLPAIEIRVPESKP